MSTALHLAKPEDLDRLLSLVAAFHAEQGLEGSDEARAGALAPLLEGIPHGAVYLIGPVRAPIGYIVVTFGWSVELGGLDAFIDEIYVRPAVRGRGIATDVLIALPRALAGAGVQAIHLEVERSNEVAQRLYARAGFQGRGKYLLMSKRL
ncbi:GNAT family N-acetyltransferase [Seohaeicola saemankumensis]|nr:GNAT family N-acetyltransferase [Seohaeicola saemankumensis]MCA0872020.1 GNAT family N-acetyltransferase [Seohaeicola saemankumensis]